MKFQLFGCHIRLDFGFFLVLAVFLAADKTGFGILMVLAALFHEMGHLAVMLLLKLRVSAVAFTPFGIKIEKEPLLRISLWGEGLLYLAGPLANLLLAAGMFLGYPRRFFRDVFIVINLIMAAFNLLPIASLDGGNLCKAWLGKKVSSDKLEMISNCISIATLIPLFAGACLLIIGGSGNFTLLVTCLYLAALVVYQ